MITGGSQARNMEMNDIMKETKADARIIINVLGGFSLIFFVSQPPLNVPIQTDNIPTIAGKAKGIMYRQLVCVVQTKLLKRGICIVTVTAEMSKMSCIGAILAEIMNNDDLFLFVVVVVVVLCL